MDFRGILAKNICNYSEHIYIFGETRFINTVDPFFFFFTVDPLSHRS